MVRRFAGVLGAGDEPFRFLVAAAFLVAFDLPQL